MTGVGIALIALFFRWGGNTVMEYVRQSRLMW